MRIESLIRPKPRAPNAPAARTVNCYGKDYVFKELAPGRFIAEVTDERAVNALVATGQYREYTDELPASTLSAPAPVPAAATKAATKSAPPPADPAPASPANTEHDEAAKQLLSGVPAQVKKAAKSAARPVLERALQLETAQERPRPSVVALLQETLAA